MDEEQKGVDFFTFDSVQELLNRTKARRNRLNAAKDDGTGSLSLSHSSTSTVTSISNGRGSPLKPLNSNGSLISSIPFADESSIVGKKKEEKTEEKKKEEKTESSVSVISAAEESSGPISSILKTEEDLPRYKVEIQSRFSPTKKPAAPVYRPSPSKLNKQNWVSSIALPMPAKTTSCKVEPKPCRVPSTSRIGASGTMDKGAGEREEKKEEKKFEIPESAPISTRIENLQKLFGGQREEPESGPERLPVFAKKRLFERKIKEEETLAQEGMKRNEYLAQKRGLSSSDISASLAPNCGAQTHPRPSVAGILGNGKVKKMLERLTSPNGHCKSSDEENGHCKSSDEESGHCKSGHCNNGHCKCNEEDPKPSRRSRVSFKLPTPDSSALDHFEDIDNLSVTHSDAFSPQSVSNVYFNPQTFNSQTSNPQTFNPQTSNSQTSNPQTFNPHTSDKYSDGYDDMELDSQSSQENSPRKSFYTGRREEEEEEENSRLYPTLPSVEEADSVHSSPSKRTRFHDDERFSSSGETDLSMKQPSSTSIPLHRNGFQDDERFSSSGETDLSMKQPSSTSIPLHEAIEKAVNEKLGGPLRTLSQYRLEQKKKDETNAAVVPRIVYGTMRRDERKEAVEEMERKTRIHHRISHLRKEEVPKYETMIEQTSNLLNRLKPSDFGSEAHADSERHLKVLGLKRIEAMNEAHRLQTLVETKRKPPTDFVTGSIDFERIDVPVDHQLRLAFSHGLATKEYLNQFYFVAVTYSGVVHASECRTLREGIASEFLSFKLPHGLKICSVRHDFEVKIEIFGWTVDEKSFGSKGFKSKLTPKKGNKQKTIQSPAGPMAIRNSQFTLRGSLVLTHKNLLKKKQALTQFLDKSLNGTIDLQVKLEPEFKKSYSNFLHFYEDSDGSWRRRWVRLDGHKLIYWLTPESSERGDPPLNEIDMKLCINPFIARLTSDVCPRKNSFSLILASYPDQTANRINYLLNKNYTSVNRMFVAADVSEDCDEWINQIASLIQGMRLWDPQALRSCSVADFDRYIRAD